MTLKRIYVSAFWKTLYRAADIMHLEIMLWDSYFSKKDEATRMLSKRRPWENINSNIYFTWWQEKSGPIHLYIGHLWSWAVNQFGMSLQRKSAFLFVCCNFQTGHVLHGLTYLLLLRFELLPICQKCIITLFFLIQYLQIQRCFSAKNAENGIFCFKRCNLSTKLDDLAAKLFFNCTARWKFPFQHNLNNFHTRWSI